MRRIHSRTAALCAVAVVAVVAVAVGLQETKAQQASQAPSVKRSILLKQDMTIAGREAVMAKVEIPPGGREGRHTHPAEVYAFVEEGTIRLEVEGKPTRTYTAGEVFSIPPGLVHEGSNEGSSPARLSAVFIAEKGKPLTTQVQ